MNIKRRLKKLEGKSSTNELTEEDILWIHIVCPEEGEVSWIARFMNCKLPEMHSESKECLHEFEGRVNMVIEAYNASDRL